MRVKYKPQLALALMLFAGLSTQVQAVSEPPPASVVLSQANQQWLQSTLEVPGTIVSRHDAVLAAEESGRLQNVVDVGEMVIAGEVVAKIDDEYLKLELKEADADISRLQTRLTYLQRRLDRLSEMAKRQSSSQQELDDAESERQMAQQELIRAQVKRAKIQYQLSRTEVRAPFSGIVVSRMQQPGEYTDTGEELVRLVDTNTLEVRVQAPLRLRHHIQAGEPMDVSYQQQRYRLPIRTLIPVGDERSRTMEIRLSVTEPQLMSVGAAVKVAVPAGEGRNALVVERDALVLREQGSYLFTVDSDQRAQRIAVELGAGKGEWLEVFGDIKPGEKVVVRGAERLQPGQKVQSAELLSKKPEQELAEGG